MVVFLNTGKFILHFLQQRMVQSPQWRCRPCRSVCFWLLLQTEEIRLCQLWNTLYVGRRIDSDGMKNGSHLFKTASFPFTSHWLPGWPWTSGLGWCCLPFLELIVSAISCRFLLPSCLGIEPRALSMQGRRLTTWLQPALAALASLHLYWAHLPRTTLTVA